MLPMIYMAIVDDDEIPAFEIIYEECKDKAYMTAIDILADPMLAEDCVADVFMSIARSFQKVNKLKPYEIVRYIVISSKNRAYDIVRKERKYKEHELLDEDIYPDDNSLSEINIALWKEVIKGLKPTDRDILYLKLIKGYDYKDISQMLGISNAAAKQRFWEAKKKLLKKLKEEGVV